jgi:hypothetical protein
MAVNEITASKVEYALALTALGLRVFSYIPERIVPPVIVVTSGSPYLTPVTVDGEWLMNLEVMVIAAPAVNSKATELLDKALETLLNGNPDYARIVNVSQPYSLQTNNAEFLAANLTVEMRITL